MDKTLERDYQTYKTFDKEFHMATDEEGKEETRAKVRKLYAEIQSRGTTYCDIFNLYKEAQEKGNKYIDVHDSLYNTDEKDLILGLRNMESRDSHSAQAGRVQLKPHGFSFRMVARWKA